DPLAPPPGCAEPVVPAPVPGHAGLLRPPGVTGRRELPSLDLAAAPGVDRRTDDRLRRGRIEIQARIDLHGLTQAQAHAALSAFVMRGWHEGRRTLLVITGKGSTGNGDARGTTGRGEGVLRAAVPRWLNEAALRPLVLAIRHAQPRHGGEGALYVLLKRNRNAS
ncbi:MAG TPA: Smr/MutS family protein, partial [Arenibaculum sp.]|nr:Smr/MutS family protein [Arenibaculum sp.]